MSWCIMDEASLEESLADYKSQSNVPKFMRDKVTTIKDFMKTLKGQLTSKNVLTWQQSFLLSQIETLLQCCEDEESKAELEQLKEDVTNLITLTEDSLLSFKKSRLLQSLENGECSQLVSEEPLRAEDDEQDSKDSEEQDLMGVKCRAPYTFEWGGSEYHNAMIFSIEDDEKVRVLFLNPTHMSMLPCSFWMDGKCKFSEEECRYSHGQVVSLSDLESYREPDFSLIAVGNQCLAQYEDGIWYKATVRDIEEDQITVHYDTYNMDITVDLHSLLPFESNDSLESDDESGLSDTGANENLDDSDFVAELSWRPSTVNAPLGEWEAHTKGFGSKMMAAMGYVIGKGLGKHGQGRVEPVEITLLPAGKSLDKVAELREQGKLLKPGKQQKRKKITSFENASMTPGSSQRNSINQGSDVFQFINSKLHSKGKFSSEQSDTQHRHNLKESYDEIKRTMNRKRKGESSKSDKGKDYNIQLFKSSEKLSGVKKKLAKQKEALSRNLGRDEKMVAALRRSIQSTEQEIRELERNEQMISQRINSKSQNRKLAIF